MSSASAPCSSGGSSRRRRGRRAACSCRRLRSSTTSPARSATCWSRDHWDLADSLAQMYRSGAKDGAFRDDLAPEQFAHDLHGLMLAHFHAFRLLRDPAAEAHTRYTFERLLQSLLRLTPLEEPAMAAPSTEKSTIVRTQLPPVPPLRPLRRRRTRPRRPGAGRPRRAAPVVHPGATEGPAGDPRRHHVPHRPDRRAGLGRRADRLPRARLGRPPRAAALARRAAGRRRAPGRRVRRARARRLRTGRARGPADDPARDDVRARHGDRCPRTRPRRRRPLHGRRRERARRPGRDAHRAAGPGHPAGRPDHLHRGLRAHPGLQRADPAPVRGPHAGARGPSSGGPRHPDAGGQHAADAAGHAWC